MSHPVSSEWIWTTTSFESGVHDDELLGAGFAGPAKRGGPVQSFERARGGARNCRHVHGQDAQALETLYHRGLVVLRDPVAVALVELGRNAHADEEGRPAHGCGAEARLAGGRRTAARTARCGEKRRQ